MYEKKIMNEKKGLICKKNYIWKKNLFKKNYVWKKKYVRKKLFMKKKINSFLFNLKKFSTFDGYLSYNFRISIFFTRTVKFYNKFTRRFLWYYNPPLLFPKHQIRFSLGTHVGSPFNDIFHFPISYDGCMHLLVAIFFL